MDDGTHDMFMDLDEEIRFRVVEEIFIDTSPTTGESEKLGNTAKLILFSLSSATEGGGRGRGNGQQ